MFHLGDHHKDVGPINCTSSGHEEKHLKAWPRPLFIEPLCKPECRP